MNSASAAVQCFNMTILCDVDQVQMVVTSMQKCYDFVEVAYGYNKAKELGMYGQMINYKHTSYTYHIILSYISYHLSHSFTCGNCNWTLGSGWEAAHRQALQ